MNASSKLQIGEPLLQWLDSLPYSVPLRVREINKEKSSSLQSSDDSNSPQNDGERLGQFLANSRLPVARAAQGSNLVFGFQRLGCAGVKLGFRFSAIRSNDF